MQMKIAFNDQRKTPQNLAKIVPPLTGKKSVASQHLFTQTKCCDATITLHKKSVAPQQFFFVKKVLRAETFLVKKPC